MKNMLPAKTQQRLRFDAGEFRPMTIDEIDGAVRTGTQNQRRNGIDRMAERIFDQVRQRGRLGVFILLLEHSTSEGFRRELCSARSRGARLFKLHPASTVAQAYVTRAKERNRFIHVAVHGMALGS